MYARRPDHGAGLRERGVRRIRERDAHRLGNAEVGDYGSVAREHHVVRLDVAVYDPTLVRVGERARHITQHAECVGNR